MTRNLIQGLLISGMVTCLDQASKWWITEVVMSPPQIIPMFPFLNIALVHNRGISFGLFAAGSETGKWVLVGVATAITMVLLRWLYKAPSGLSVVAFGLIIGGAAGNVIDRIAIGAVVDFLDFHAYGFHWPAFNVADACIFIGAVLLIGESLFRPENST